MHGKHEVTSSILVGGFLNSITSICKLRRKKPLMLVALEKLIEVKKRTFVDGAQEDRPVQHLSFLWHHPHGQAPARVACAWNAAKRKVWSENQYVHQTKAKNTAVGYFISDYFSLK